MAPRPYKRSCGGSSPLTRGKPGARISGRAAVRLIPAHAGKTHGDVHRPALSWAHPRSRGENGCLPRSPSSGWGSSPLTRGKLDQGQDRRHRDGLIPAHAGKTKTALKPPDSWGAHPRSRGENSLRASEEQREEGSSPLTRGKLTSVSFRCGIVGLIPAHAGKTTTPFPRSRNWWAHPRSRGENLYFDYITFQTPGSSPLTRGKL